ncbi:MAG: hypothetical protein M1833_004307 [Piccolia ochrophora]|nr:MAG: hypothetical protein M1833_004307 [Piccolia ochrophora]
MAENEPLEVDDFSGEGDSSYGSDAASDTTSLASSIQMYRHENGRTYHAYKDGHYVFPNDERELDRLGWYSQNARRFMAEADLQHHLFTLTLDNKLHLAPVKGKAQNVLDIGTGTGIWAIDYADEHPSAQVVGTDLSPTQPSFVPPNLRFVIDDAEEEWAFSHKFDFVHCRMMVGSFKDWFGFIKRCNRNLEPDGWLEIQDLTNGLRCDDGSLTKDSALYKWDQLMMQGANNLGRPVDVGPQYVSMMEEAGFVDVQCVMHKWPQNPWPKARKVKELGMWSQQNVEDGLQGLSLAILTRGLGWTAQEVEVFLVDVRKDIRDRRIHTYWDIYVVYGKKADDP